MKSLSWNGVPVLDPDTDMLSATITGQNLDTTDTITVTIAVNDVVDPDLTTVVNSGDKVDMDASLLLVGDKVKFNAELVSDTAVNASTEFEKE